MNDFPVPEQVEYADILDVITRFFADHYTKVIHPGFEFAHVVLEDLNLDNGSINFCMGLGASWAERATKRHPMHAREIEKYRVDTLDLLRWLLRVPESKRDILLCE